MIRRILCLSPSAELCSEVGVAARRLGANLQFASDWVTADLLVEASLRSGTPFDSLIIDLGQLGAAEWFRNSGEKFESVVVVGLQAMPPNRRLLSSVRFVGAAPCASHLIGAIGHTQTALRRQAHEVEVAMMDAPNDDPVFQELVNRYRVKLVSIAEEVTGAHSAGDTQKLSLLSHRLRGTAPSYGFQEVGRAAAVLEDQLRAGATGSQLTQAVQGLLEVLKQQSVP